MNIILALLISPFLLGIINKVKALFAGRIGPPVFQVYYDISKLLRKDAVYSLLTSQQFRFAPVISFVSLILVLALLPIGNLQYSIGFTGDIFIIVYLLAVVRFFTIVAALDTGSSFEGMGSAREAMFAIFTEPVMLISLLCFYKITDSMSLREIFFNSSFSLFSSNGTSLFLIFVSIFIVMLTETSRIPVDDPNTHLELTMVHEVMVLDHGGFDLGVITINYAMKFWFFASLLSNLIMPYKFTSTIANIITIIILNMIIAVIVGIVESTMARIKLNRIHNFIIASFALALIALIILQR